MNTTPESLFVSADASGEYGARRAASFVASVALHAAVLGALAFAPRDWSLYVTPRPYEKNDEPPRERFVLYYQPPELPAIAPTNTEASLPADPDVLAVQRMVSVPEVPTLNQTRVYLPEAPPQPTEKVEAENVVVLNPQPEPEPVRRVAPKTFVVPTPRRVEREVIDADASVPPASAAGPIVPATTSALVNLPDAPPRPPAAPEPAKQAAAAAPAAQGTEVDPQAKAPATVAVVSPNPTSGKTPLSSAEADFRVGPPAARDPAARGPGSVEGAVTTVPNLAVAAAKPPAPPSPAAAATPAAGRRPLGAPSRTLLSVALRPGARRLPAPVEAVFGPRDVYVCLLETRAEGGRGPDWTLWFADVAGSPSGRAPLFRPPMPLNPIPVTGLLSPVATEGKTLHIRGVVRQSGQFEVIGDGEEESKNRVAGVLRNTPFLPANRNGVATDVDVVIEVRGAR